MGARRLEAYSHALLKQHGQSNDSSELRYEPLWNQSGEVKRLKIQATPLAHEDLKAAVAGWASLSTGWRCRIGLQLSTSAQELLQPEFGDRLKVALEEFGCPTKLCTVALDEEPINQPADADALIQKMLGFRQQGIRLAWIYKGYGGDPASTLHQLSIDELQIEIHPSIDSKQHEAEQALISALARLAKPVGLMVSAIQPQSEIGEPHPWGEWVDLRGGGHPEQTTHTRRTAHQKGQVSQPRET
jgi:EAL domain-containing protein (putative c-di-GMP-specific phosphodiesterase class I)